MIHTGYIEAKREAREQIAQQTALYRRSKGKIHRIPTGYSIEAERDKRNLVEFNGKVRKVTKKVK